MAKTLALATLLSASLMCASTSFAGPDEREARVNRQATERIKRVEPRASDSKRSLANKAPTRIDRDSRARATDKKPNFSIPKNTNKHVQDAMRDAQAERRRVLDARENSRPGNSTRATTRAEGVAPNQQLIRRQYNHTERERTEIPLPERNRQTITDTRRTQQHINPGNNGQRHADYNQRDRQRRERPRIVVNQYYHNPGDEIRRLPTGIRRLYHRPFPLYYFGGTYYRPRSGGFVVVSAPIGVRVRTLPIGYATLTFGTTMYYHVNDVFYRRFGTEYVVVEAPSDNYNVPVASTYSSGDWAIYPRYGQSDEELQQDRYECHLWAFERTNYDPSMPYQDNRLRGDYYRAQAACLEGRGYTVK